VLLLALGLPPILAGRAQGAEIIRVVQMNADGTDPLPGLFGLSSSGRCWR
jgi:hypothetical protein